LSRICVGSDCGLRNPLRLVVHMISHASQTYKNKAGALASLDLMQIAFPWLVSSVGEHADGSMDSVPGN
jgi:hypothetical protein